jgi:hypothetical protein
VSPTLASRDLLDVGDDEADLAGGQLVDDGDASGREDPDLEHSYSCWVAMKRILVPS